MNTQTENISFVSIIIACGCEGSYLKMCGVLKYVMFQKQTNN